MFLFPNMENIFDRDKTKNIETLPKNNILILGDRQ